MGEDSAGILFPLSPTKVLVLFSHAENADIKYVL